MSNKIPAARRWATAVGELLRDKMDDGEKVGITMRGIVQPYFGIPAEVDIDAGFVIVQDRDDHSCDMDATMLRIGDITAVNYVKGRDKEKTPTLQEPSYGAVMDHLQALEGVDLVFVRWTAALYGIDWPPLPKRGS